MKTPLSSLKVATLSFVVNLFTTLTLKMYVTGKKMYVTGKNIFCNSDFFESFSMKSFFTIKDNTFPV